MVNNPLRFVDPSRHVPIIDAGDGVGRVTSDPRNLDYWLVSETNYLPTLPEGRVIFAWRCPGALQNLLVSYPYAYEMFIKLVGNGAPLDVKDKIRMRLGDTIQFANFWFEWSTPGNILYGFYGSA